MLDIVLIGILTGLLYGSICLGAAINFRVLAFPDLTLEGGAAFSGAVSWFLFCHHCNWIIALCGAMAAGFGAGLLTGSIRLIFRVGPLLSGLISASILYSLFFRLTRGVANIPIPSGTKTLFDLSGARTAEKSTLLVTAIIAVTLIALIYFFKTRCGYLLRAIGEQPRFVEQLGHSANFLRMVGLAVGNALIGLGSGILVQYRTVVDVNIVGGLLISTLASIMLGESICRPRTTSQYLLSMLAGSIIYSILVGIALYDWSPSWTRAVKSTDVRALAGLFFLLSAWLGSRRTNRKLFSSEW